EPWEYAPPRGRSYADPTPIRRLHSTIRRSAFRPRSVSTRPLPPVPGQTCTHCARFLHPHARRCRLRRHPPRAPLPVPSLPAHRIAVARIRLALPAIQHPVHRTVSPFPSAPHADTDNRRRQSVHALSARAVLDSTLSPASRNVVRRAGGVDQAGASAGLRQPGPAHAPIHGVDARAPLPSPQPSLPPAGLAPQSGSRRPPSRIVPGRRAGLRLPHTICMESARLPLYALGREK